MMNDPHISASTRAREHSGPGPMPPPQVASNDDIVVIDRNLIHVFSHQLRSLLTSVSAAADFMLHHETDADTETEMLRIIAGQSERIHGLLNDFMVVLSPQRQRCTACPVDLDALVRQVVRELAAEAEAIAAWLVLDTAGAIPPVQGERSALHQAVTGAVRSIIRLTQPGERVIIGLERIGVPEGDAAVELTVAVQSDDEMLAERATALSLEDLSLNAAHRILSSLGGDLRLMPDRPGIVCLLPGAPVNSRPAVAASLSTGMLTGT